MDPIEKEQIHTAFLAVMTPLVNAVRTAGDKAHYDLEAKVNVMQAPDAAVEEYKQALAVYDSTLAKCCCIEEAYIRGTLTANEAIAELKAMLSKS